MCRWNPGCCQWTKWTFLCKDSSRFYHTPCNSRNLFCFQTRRWFWQPSWRLHFSGRKRYLRCWNFSALQSLEVFWKCFKQQSWIPVLWKTAFCVKYSGTWSQTSSSGACFVYQSCSCSKWGRRIHFAQWWLSWSFSIYHGLLNNSSATVDWNRSYDSAER